MDNPLTKPRPTDWRRVAVEHIEYWRSTVQAVCDKASDLRGRLDAAQHVSTLARDALVRLRLVEDKLHKVARLLSDCTDGRLAVPTEFYPRIHIASEQVHHLESMFREDIASLHAAWVPCTWPMGTVGENSLLSGFAATIQCIRGHVLGQSSGEHHPIVRTRWIIRYNYYPHSQVVCIPHPDLHRMVMWPLIAHEIGHAAINAVIRRAEPAHIRAIKDIQSLYTRALQQLGSPGASTPAGSLRSQVIELLCDFFAVRQFGFGYLLPLMLFLPNDLLPIYRNADDFVEWAWPRGHPPTLVRFALCMRKCVQSESIPPDDHVTYAQELRRSGIGGGFGETLFATMYDQMEALANACNAFWANAGSTAELTREDSMAASDMMQWTEQDIHVTGPWTLFLAASYKRLYHRDQQLGSFVPPLLTALRNWSSN